METVLRKLSSRKLWVAIAGIATGIVIALGGNTAEIGDVASSVTTIAGAITAVLSAMTYICQEGKIDEAGVKNSAAATCAADIEEQTNDSERCQ